MMDKIDYISEYFAGAYAYYLFQIDSFNNDSKNTQHLLNKKYLNAAKISFLSNVMLGIKEDMVENKGNLVYQSKLFINSLEYSVLHIATQENDGYRIGSYVFPDASTLVAFVRNKLAHGMYTMDLEHNRVILHHKGNNIILNIDDLVSFVVNSFANTINHKKTNKYERNIVYYNKVNSSRQKPITDINEIKKIIKSYNAVNFIIETNNSMPVPQICISRLEIFLKGNYTNFDAVLTGLEYKKLVKFMADYGCTISRSYDRLTDVENINNVVKYAEADLIGNEKLNYMEQIKLLGMEIQKRLNNKYNNFNALASNINDLVILDAITRTASVNQNSINRYIASRYSNSVKMGYDEFGMTLISMFNTLFVYPFDDIYSIKGEYTADRSNGLDFSELNLSMVNPMIINIDNYPLVNAQERINSIAKKQMNISNEIFKQENNLKKIQNNEKARTVITLNIKSLKQELSMLISEYIKADADLKNITDDYSLNSDYFKNKSIVEGIRNSIAHGHYEFISDGQLSDTIIIFNDIYEGKLTFQAKLTFGELEQLILSNKDYLISFIEEKKSLYNNKLIKK